MITCRLFKLFHTQAICTLYQHASNKGYDMFALFNMKNEIFFHSSIVCENGCNLIGVYSTELCAVSYLSI